MKIIYTKDFKEKLSHPWSNISLGKVKLREGTETGLTKQDMSKVMDGFPNSFLVGKITKTEYTPDIIRLPGGGIQIYLEIPPEDQSFVSEDYTYQVLLFFYTDLLTDESSLAFVCYEKIEYKDKQERVEFSGLELTTRKNIITIPGLEWSGNIKFSQSEVTKFLESPVGDLKVSPLLENTGNISVDSWRAWKVDQVSEATLTPWIETTYINKYGIKIY